jgi:hypothetical protein
MSRQSWQELIWWATADGTAVANTITETILFPDVTIPGNYMADGRVIRVTAAGRWSNVVTAVPTLIFALRWGGVGGTIMAQSPAIVTPATATTNALWEVTAMIQTRVNGSSGSLFTMAKVLMGEDAAPTFGTVTNYGVYVPFGSAGAATPAAVTLNLAADTALSLTADWSAANAANTIQGHQYFGESLN